MNDLERQIRDTLLRHQEDAPMLDTSDARRAAGRARRRQARNVIAGVTAGVALIVAFAAFGGAVQGDRSPTLVDDPPSPSPSVSTPAPVEGKVHGWPTTTRNRAGLYSWDAHQKGGFSVEGFMHNAYAPGSGGITILFEGEPGRLIPHRGQTAVTVAGREGTYRRITGKAGPSVCYGMRRCMYEEWMVDIRGTTVTLKLIAKRDAPEDEVAEARAIIESIRMQRRDNELGFRLIFTLATNTWDSG